jgi:RecB family exonuclease
MQLTVDHDDQAIQVLSIEGAMCGVCGDEPGDRNCPDCERCRRDYLTALRKAGWAPRAEIQQQLDQAQTELAAIKKQLAGLAARAGGPR